ncbi:esterase [Tieghemostelium lacteum]|uniref:S-formylglutathione hydrolase n=1 Tax=Tieghemostelium lacteum TaxID=361077 RepID=A0A151Z2Y2_TIELA|nr:esterase [Tieghemostelium lacteum]|eukprot:KYQ88309.1 esterase [Tieghemostelium lacteum]
MDSLKELSKSRSFDGNVIRYSHESKELGCEMKFHIYVPPAALTQQKKVPVLWFLAGITSTDENFIIKSGAIRYASKEGLLLVCPDTSPRGCKIAGEDDSWDFGTGAGFYLDATQEPWSKNYRMYSYVSKELFQLVNSAFANWVQTDNHGMMGHSMGGCGALNLTFKNPGQYKSLSVFAPICDPSNGKLGAKCFKGYLGDNQDLWNQYNPSHLAKSYQGEKLDILIDQGTADEFLNTDLFPETLTKVQNPNLSFTLRYHEGYPHNYFFISTFVEDHFNHHSSKLNKFC